jgi:hypothetical protein
MTTTEIRDKLTKFQSTLTMLQREEKGLLDELKSLGLNSIDEAKAYLEKLTEVDIRNLEVDAKNLEVELQKWMQ